MLDEYESLEQAAKNLRHCAGRPAFTFDEPEEFCLALAEWLEWEAIKVYPSNYAVTVARRWLGIPVEKSPWDEA